MMFWNAFTAASHCVLIFAALLLMVEVVAAMRNPNSYVLIGRSVSIRLAGYAVLSTLVVERSYYVVARLVQHRGVNLWAAHPAPELLSLGVAAGILVLWGTFAAAMRGGLSLARPYILSICAIIVLLWAALVIVMIEVA